MFAIRGDDDVAMSTVEFLRDVASELKSDGIEIRLVFGHATTANSLIDAWYPASPNHVAVIECDSAAFYTATADCLATTIRERLRATAPLAEDHQTWDHTGTLWPD